MTLGSGPGLGASGQDGQGKPNRPYPGQQPNSIRDQNDLPHTAGPESWELITGLYGMNGTDV